jgi:hypothetical protein
MLPEPLDEEPLRERCDRLLLPLDVDVPVEPMLPDDMPD